jgi:hypothetical protein
MENFFQAELIAEYLESLGMDLTNLILEQIKDLQFPQPPFPRQDPVVNGKTAYGIQGEQVTSN